MRIHRWRAGLGVALVAWGCGVFKSEDAPPEAPSPGSDAGQADASDAKDAGATTPDASAAPDAFAPDMPCAGKLCELGVCCLHSDNNPPQSCETRCLRTGDVAVACDDTADCAPYGLLCCVSRQNSVLLGATCQADCEPGFRACDPTKPTECGPGKGCGPYANHLGGLTFSPDYPFFLCDP